MKKDKLWFRAKAFGWGWYPISWQGWAVTLLYITSIIMHVQSIDIQVYSVSDFLISFSIPFIINTIFLLIICYAHGERPRWRWGEK